MRLSKSQAGIITSSSFVLSEQPMKFSKPHGDMAWLSFLWAFAGVALIATNSVPMNATYLSIGVFSLSCAILVWLDVRAISWPLIILIAPGVIVPWLALTDHFRAAASSASAAYMMYVIYHWNSSPETD